MTLGFFSQVTREEVEERLHLNIKCLIQPRISQISAKEKIAQIYLLLVGIALDSVHQSIELIAHGLGRDASSRAFEVLFMSDGVFAPATKANGRFETTNEQRTHDEKMSTARCYRDAERFL